MITKQIVLGIVFCMWALPITPQTYESSHQVDQIPTMSLDVYLLIGQSNMAGRAEIEEQDKDTLENVFLFTGIENREWEKAANPLNKYSTVRKGLPGQRLGPGYYFARNLASSVPGKRIGLVVNARGGTPIALWMPGEELYNEAVKQARAASEYGTFKGIVWHQGEGNGRGDGYLEKITLLIESLREDLNEPDLPFVAGQLMGNTPARIVFNEMISLLPEKIPNSGVAGSTGLTSYDGAHFDSVSQRILGKRYAKTMLKLIE